MHVVTVELEVKPEHLDVFRAAILQQARDSLERESDCLRFDVCFDPEDQRRLFLYMLYKEEAAFQEHRRTEYAQEFDDAVRDWVDRRTVQVWTREPI